MPSTDTHAPSHPQYAHSAPQRCPAHRALFPRPPCCVADTHAHSHPQYAHSAPQRCPAHRALCPRPCPQPRPSSLRTGTYCLHTNTRSSSPTLVSLTGTFSVDLENGLCAFHLPRTCRPALQPSAQPSASTYGAHAWAMAAIAICPKLCSSEMGLERPSEGY